MLKETGLASLLELFRHLLDVVQFFVDDAVELLKITYNFS